MDKQLIPIDTANYARLIDMAINAVSSRHSKRVYRDAIQRFFVFHDPRSGPISREVVQAWRAAMERAGRSPATINVGLSAMRRLVKEAEAGGYLDKRIADGIISIPNIKSQGIRLGNWLEPEEVQKLLALPDRATLLGKRDLAMLCLLFGAGLRRAEACSVEVSQLEQHSGRWLLVDIEGKRRRIRTVPVVDWVADYIRDWVAAAGLTEGKILRAVYRGDSLGDRLDETTVYARVLAYAKVMGRELEPHDLRRTAARLALLGGSPIEQIQIWLGHANPVTTARYLGTRQDLVDSPGDRLGVKG